MGKQGDFVFFGQSVHVGCECAPEHISVFFGVCDKCSPKTFVFKMPVQVKCKTDCGDTKLSTLQDDKEVDAFFQARGNFFHHIGLSTEQVVHLAKTLLLGFNLEL